MKSIIKAVKNSPLAKSIYSPLNSFIDFQMKKKFLRKNIEYKDKYKGKRCFIIGNGPSLKKHDLTLLKDEFVLTVNSMTITKEFDLITPDFHVMVDSTRFNVNNEIMHKNILDLANKKDSPICVFPLRFKDYIEKYNIDKKVNIIYVYANSKVRQINRINLTGRVPPYQNVLNIALYSAIYLGFSKIYLIGYDMTGFISVYDENNNISYGGHFYEDDNKREKKYMEKLHRERTNEFLLSAYASVFKLLRLTKEYALKHGVEIYNAGKGGALDVFPKIKYEDLFDE